MKQNKPSVLDNVSRYDASTIMWNLDGVPLHPTSKGEYVRFSDIEKIVVDLEEKLTFVNNGALGEVIAERRRQIEAEGWTPEHDDKVNADGKLARAAATYAWAASLSDAVRYVLGSGEGNHAWDVAVFRRVWPWDRRWWKPKDRHRDLIRAAALILAELDRLERMAKKVKEKGK